MARAMAVFVFCCLGGNREAKSIFNIWNLTERADAQRKYMYCEVFARLENMQDTETYDDGVQTSENCHMRMGTRNESNSSNAREPL